MTNFVFVYRVCTSDMQSNSDKIIISKQSQLYMTDQSKEGKSEPNHSLEETVTLRLKSAGMRYPKLPIAPTNHYQSNNY